MENISNEDKASWCQQGLNWEHDFVANKNFRDISIEMNNDKESNPYTYDMKGLFPCDLKTIHTPWKYAPRMFGIPSDFAISINHKDLSRYRELYPNIILILDVQYPNYKNTHWANLHLLRQLILNNKAFLHEYKNRINDTNGNAKNSYVFDIRDIPVLY